MDLKEFSKDFHENVEMSVEIENADYDEELARSIIEYIIDNGEVNAPEICTFQKTKSRITAYDYNDEAESLDLFFLIKSDTPVGKINNSKVETGYNYLSSFYREAIDGSIFKHKKAEENDEIVEVARLIQSTKGKISQLRLYIITDGLVDPTASIATVDSDEGYTIEFNIWDMQRVYQQHNLRAGKEKVEIDFPTSYNTELQCLKMMEINPYIDAYLAIIPGITLAKIYKQYQQILLEKNVRTFLQFKGKVNRDIRTTLRESPDMFFSYNNGISTTASSIETKEKDGSLYITRLFDWQIVNGGQTTASIAACLNDHSVDLNKVFVPMKVSVIQDKEHDEEIVKAISHSANSQTAIKNSDFSANDPYLIELEKYSRQEWVPNGSNKPINKWYFERTRGQYLDQLAQLSGVNERQFKVEYPKTQKITKTDIAKYVRAWELTPYDVCKGAEKNYNLFVAQIKSEKPSITEKYFKKIVAECILFKTIDSMVRSKNLGGYKSNMNAYIMSSISFLSERKLDYVYIWENQRVQEQVVEKIEELIPLVWMHLTQLTSHSNPNQSSDVIKQGSNVNEWSKKLECWNSLKIKLGDIEEFSQDVKLVDSNEDGTYLNESQILKMQEANDISEQTWFSLAKWAKSNNMLTPLYRKSAYNFGVSKSRGKEMVSLKQALYALKILKEAEENGFENKE